MDKKPSERVKKALQLAWHWAQANKISGATLRLILATSIQDSKSVAAKLIDRYGAQKLNTKHLSKEIALAARKGFRTPTPARMADEYKLGQSAEAAIDEAKKNALDIYGSEHMLLGILAVNTQTHELEEVFQPFGIVSEEIATWLREQIKPSAEPAGAPASANTAPTASPLKSYCTDLTELAETGKLDTIIGREKEIEEIFKSLSRRTKNNVVLLGKSGVGKSAISHALAIAISKGEAPKRFSKTRIYTLELSKVIAGTIYRGMFEDRIKNLLAELEHNDAIIFIKKITTLIGAGNSAEGLDASNLFQTAWSRGKCRTVGTATGDEWQKIQQQKPDFSARFRPITINEPSTPQTIEILKGTKADYEKHHGVVIPEETIEVLVPLADRYIRDRAFPDKGIDILDEACGNAAAEGEREEQRLQQAKMQAIQDEDFEMAAEIKQKMNHLRENGEGVQQIVTPDHVARVIGSWTNMPIDQIYRGDTEHFKNKEAEIKNSVIGQPEAVETILRALRRARSPLRDPQRPIGAYILLGPTGVGKTLLSKMACEGLGGKKDHLIRIDCGKLQEKFQLSELLGSAPGYVGYRESGKLKRVNQQPLSVIIFDEVEKAHPDIFDALLAIIEEGEIEDGSGQPIYFHDCLILLTSNLGAGTSTAQCGFHKTNGKTERDNAIQKALRGHFRPEFLNRLDDIIIFNSLGKTEMEKIYNIELAKIEGRSKELTLNIDERIKTKVLEKGFNPEYGARPLKRAMQKWIEDPLIHALDQKTITLQKPVHITMGENDTPVVNNQQHTEPTTI